MNYRKFFLALMFTGLLLTGSCDKLKNTFGNSTGKSASTTQVDSYPLFDQCKSMKSKLLQKKCFQDAVYTYYKTHLGSIDFQSKNPVDEKIIIHLEIGKDNKAKILEIKSSDEIKQAFPDLPAHLQSFTAELVLQSPAMKNGTPVTTRYKLPIHLKTHTTAE